jgi:hypothetical protein
MPGFNHLQPNDDVDDSTTHPPPHLIQEFNDYSIANIFCFGAFANKLLGVVYNACTGDFPYMSLDGNIFFVMYHYKTNTILITPIAGLDSEHILEANKTNLEHLVSKGFKLKVNKMDNQATKTIKAYLIPHQVTLQLIKPRNRWVTQQVVLSKPSRIDSLAPLAPQIASSPFSCGTNLLPKCKIASTSSGACSLHPGQVGV